MKAWQFSGDPRRPNEVQKYKPPPAEEAEQSDLRQVGGLLCGLIALFFKSKLAAWCSVLFCLSFLANLKSNRSGQMQMIMTSLSFAIFSVMGSYMPAVRPLYGSFMGSGPTS